MNLITNKPLSYVMDRLLTNREYFSCDITRIPVEDALTYFSKHVSSCEVFMTTADNNRVINELHNLGVTTVQSYSKRLENHSNIICDIYDGKATVVEIRKIGDL